MNFFRDLPLTIEVTDEQPQQKQVIPIFNTLFDTRPYKIIMSNKKSIKIITKLPKYHKKEPIYLKKRTIM
jgi:hypothetical protein